MLQSEHNLNAQCTYAPGAEYDAYGVLKSGLGILCNRPVSHSARHQRPARERHIMCIASRENVDNQAPRNTNFTQ